MNVQDRSSFDTVFVCDALSFSLSILSERSGKYQDLDLIF